jgi:hypothetical protein
MSVWSELAVPVYTCSGALGGAVSFFSLTQRGRDAVRKFRAWRKKLWLQKQTELIQAVVDGVKQEVAPVRHEFENNGGTGMKERMVKFLETDFPEFRVETKSRLAALEARLGSQDERQDRLETRLDHPAENGWPQCPYVRQHA